MKVLIVANNKSGHFSPFVVEQVEAIRASGIDVAYFGVEGKGALGYLKSIKALKIKIKKFKPNVIHAHYGLSGLLANLQRKIPVVTTYHGSDVHSLGLILVLSKMCMRLSKYNIFVTQNLCDIAKWRKKNATVLPCGVDTQRFNMKSKADSRKIAGYNDDECLVLFSNAFDRDVKNAPLAISAVNKLDKVNLIELKGYSREEVVNLFSAVDVALMTSLNEGSPQFIKEAMACGTPIVTTDIGDVRWVIGDTDGCYITSYDPDECANAIGKAIEFSKINGKTKGRERIVELGLHNSLVAKIIIDIYKNILSQK